MENETVTLTIINFEGVIIFSVYFVRFFYCNKKAKVSFVESKSSVLSTSMVLQHAKYLCFTGVKTFTSNLLHCAMYAYDSAICNDVYLLTSAETCILKFCLMRATSFTYLIGNVCKGTIVASKYLSLKKQFENFTFIFSLHCLINQNYGSFICKSKCQSSPSTFNVSMICFFRFDIQRSR